MAEKYYLTNGQAREHAKILAVKIQRMRVGKRAVGVYGVPRGGVPVAYLVCDHMGSADAYVVDNPEEADFIVDDIIDSGATRDRFRSLYPEKLFYALFDKTAEHSKLGWIVFPWESTSEGSIENATVRLLQYIGEDPSRGGLVETPGRVTRAWQDWTSGYGQDPASVLKVFEDGGELYDEMVMVRRIPFYSHCEHHLAPFFGTADIAYIPNGKIVGLSKLSRLLDIFAKRLQVQERLTAQVADALMEHLEAKGAAVSIRARHLCMESRGVTKQGHETVTNAVRGVFKTDAAARAEFLSSVK